jgi:hypothetical protein
MTKPYRVPYIQATEPLWVKPRKDHSALLHVTLCLTGHLPIGEIEFLEPGGWLYKDSSYFEL